MALSFEAPTIHGLDRITAWGNELSVTKVGALTLTCVNAKGESVEIGLFFDRGSTVYLSDLAAAINRVGEEHGRLTDAERRLVLEEAA